MHIVISNVNVIFNVCMLKVLMVTCGFSFVSNLAIFQFCIKPTIFQFCIKPALSVTGLSPLNTKLSKVILFGGKAKLLSFSFDLEWKLPSAEGHN